MAYDCEGCEIDLVKGTEKYLNEKRISNVALGTYHVNNYGNKLIRDILTDKGFKDVKLKFIGII